MPLPWRYTAPVEEDGLARRIRRGRDSRLVSVGSSGIARRRGLQCDHRSQLDRDLTGVAIRTPDAFYGLYTVDFEKGGKLVGMLSANGHGGFIQSKDLRKELLDS